jgi:hypothetical protein
MTNVAQPGVLGPRWDSIGPTIAVVTAATTKK